MKKTLFFLKYKIASTLGNRWAGLFFVMALFFFFFLFYGQKPWGSQAQARKNYKYIGAYHCKECHSGGRHNEYREWQSSAHKDAYNALVYSSKRLKKVKAKYGLDKPSEHKPCLRCHTSGARKLLVNKHRGREYHGYEGVGCEACHGPAEKYADPSIHLASVADRYSHNQKYGMWPILGDQGIKVREKMCLRCHKKDRMCKLPDMKATEISLSIITNFQHSLNYR